MGYAVIMFGILLISSAVVVTAYNYGIAKESQITPLKAENIYAERETGKAQTGLTINNTCLAQPGQYIDANGPHTFGPHILFLAVKNNGSVVLNPNNATILYNTSYINFTVTNWKKYYDNEICKEGTSVKGWHPLTYVCMATSPSIYIDPGTPPDGPELRLLVVAENGISAIAPTSPTNFTGGTDKSNSSFMFSWNASKDDKGIDHYFLYEYNGNPTDTCPPDFDKLILIPGNQTSGVYSSSLFCQPCHNTWFTIVAVDVDGNMGIQSKTLKCPPGNGVSCGY